ncbi:hypothetical protein QCA50_019506 [Cerrena zonata]|uniref:DUF6535 domain-containing protein n=1 Tax=Cerrena zonata TaxID=2478898 RepID=A0AAW0FLD5_9APHY
MSSVAPSQPWESGTGSSGTDIHDVHHPQHPSTDEGGEQDKEQKGLHSPFVDNDGVRNGGREVNDTGAIGPGWAVGTDRSSTKLDIIQKVQVEPDRKGWARLSDMYHKYDEDRIKDVKEDIDTLLVFAGLFSAVLSAFVIETYQNLQEDPIDTNTRILTQISSQLASLAVSGNFINSTIPSFNPSSTSSLSFTAPISFVRINTLWSCSLVISLITASFGILVKQWFHEYMAQDTQTPLLRLRIRFFRTEGLEKWQVFELAAALPLLLQIALLLFFIGLSEFLRQLNPVVGWATTGVILAWLAIFVFTTIAPLLSSQCPYKTPILKRPLTYLRPRFLIGIVRAAFLPLWISITPYIIMCICLDCMRCPTTYLQWPLYKLSDFYELVESWTFMLKRHPEEADIRETTDYDGDINIIVSSESLFLDEQLKSTIGECSDNIDISTIYGYYNENLKADDERQTTDFWRVTLSPEAKGRVGAVVNTVMLHKFRNPRLDAGWSDVLGSLIASGESGLWWEQLPTVFSQLMQTDIEWGAGPVFLTLYSSATDPNNASIFFLCMYGICCRGTKEDIIDELISITRLVGEHLEFWPRSSGPTSINKNLQNLITRHQIEKDLGAFVSTFSVLLLLASPEAIKNREREVRKLTSDVLDVLKKDTELFLNATWLTYWQLNSAVLAFGNIRDNYHRGAVDEGLLTKLQELRNTAHP